VKGSGAVGFDRVGFSYPTRPTASILKCLSYDVKPGQSIALVGKCGLNGYFKYKYCNVNLTLIMLKGLVVAANLHAFNSFSVTTIRLQEK